jgi:monoamine oxidase
MARSGDEIILALEGHGPSRHEHFDLVLLTLPFTRLRTVQGLDALGFPQEKLNAIRALGYGNNAKVMCGTKSRVWRSSEAGLPVASRGTFYSDLPRQTVWETSRGQEGPGGILTNFLAGPAARADQDGAVKSLVHGLSALSPKIAQCIDREAVASFFWERYRHTLGSYAAAKVGQYTTMLEVAGTPELDGRIQFAGEHTSTDFLGYMNGAVQSGNRAASAIYAITMAHKSAG